MTIFSHLETKQNMMLLAHGASAREERKITGSSEVTFSTHTSSARCRWPLFLRDTWNRRYLDPFDIENFRWTGLLQSSPKIQLDKTIVTFTEKNLLVTVGGCDIFFYLFLSGRNDADFYVKFTHTFEIYAWLHLCERKRILFRSLYAFSFSLNLKKKYLQSALKRTKRWNVD